MTKIVKPTGILLASWEARALHTGAATALLRLVTPQPGSRWNYLGGARFCEGEHAKSDACETHAITIPCPLGAEGTVFFGKERFLWPEWENTRELCVYAVDYKDPSAALKELATFREGRTRWTSATKCAAWAARTWSQVVDVCALRLHDLSEDWARHLGAGLAKEQDARLFAPGPTLAGVANRWDGDVVPGAAWADNPWAWFVRVEATSRRDH